MRERLLVREAAGRGDHGLGLDFASLETLLGHVGGVDGLGQVRLSLVADQVEPGLGAILESEVSMVPE